MGELLLMGFAYLFTLQNIIMMVIAGYVGYLLGIMPGINSTIALSLLVPITFTMDAIPAVILLVVAYTATNFGAGVTSILVGIPGMPSAAPTVLDGYPLAKQGKARQALSLQIWVSGIGEMYSVILMIVFSIPLAAFALSFGPPEFFLLALMGLSVVAGLAAGNMTKGLLMAVFGLFLTTVGLDPIAGGFRYVVSFRLLEGIPFIPALIGLFAISEVLIMISDKAESARLEKLSGNSVTLAEIKKCKGAIGMGATIGFLLGLIPAVGPNIAAWIAYGEARRASKNPENFGKGELAGIAATESASNAAATGSLVPTLALGIPGSAAAAVLIGGLALQGITAGPLLFERNPEIPYTIFAVSLVAIPMLVFIGFTCMRFFALVTVVPKNVLAPVILVVCTLGAYSITGTMFSVWAAYIFGIFGYIVRRFNYPVAPMVLALVLGRMAEVNLRRSLILSGGSSSIFFTRPITVVIMIMTAILFTYPFIVALIKKKRSKDAAQ